MKILIVSDADLPQINGVVTTLHNLVRKLNHMGHKAKIISPQNFTCLPLPGYPEIHIPLIPFTISDSIIDFNPDVVHIATEGLLGLCAKLYCQKNDIPYFTSYHTDWETTLQMNKIWGMNWLIKKYVKYIHNGGKFTLVTNNEMRSRLETRGYSNLRTWTRGVDSNVFNPLEKQEYSFKKPIILCVSRVSVEKNLDAFLSLDLPGTKILIGHGPLLDYYKQKYPDVMFMGSMTGSLLASYYASADVFVFPSKTDTFGVVMLESIATGTPVAAYPVTGPNEVIENGVNGFLSENLIDAVTNALLVDRITTLESSKKWTWGRVAEMYLEYLDESFSKS